MTAAGRAVFDGFQAFLLHSFVDKSVENVDNSLKNYYDSELCNFDFKEKQFEIYSSSAIFRNDYPLMPARSFRKKLVKSKTVTKIYDL